MLPNDKIWHFLASLGLVWIFYVLSTVAYLFLRNNSDSRRSHDADEENLGERNESDNESAKIICYSYLGSPYWRLALASLLSLLVGAIKEIADALWNGWPWCTNGVCHADGWDFLANLIGILVGAGCLLLGIMVFQQNNQQ